MSDATNSSCFELFTEVKLMIRALYRRKVNDSASNKQCLGLFTEVKLVMLQVLMF
jgi:hypothetical protein